jgi:hypothetical protein
MQVNFTLNAVWAQVLIYVIGRCNLSFDMDANMDLDMSTGPVNVPSTSVQPHRSLGKGYFCGVCFIDCCPDSVSKGCRWHKYGDVTLDEKKWVHLCPSCDKYLWRLFSKFEELEDWNRCKKDYMLFLKHEIEKAQNMHS